MTNKRENTIYYFGSDFNWIDYLHIRKVAQRLTDNQEKNREIFRSLLSSSENIEHKLDTLNKISEQGFEFLGDKLDTVIQVIDEWGAITVERLDCVIEQLNSIRKGIITPTQTKAFEFYNIGIGYLQKGLYDLAEEPLLEAEKLYKGDFLTQYALGELYLFGANEEVSVINLQKAEYHFNNTTRYAKIEAAKVPNANDYLKMSQYYAALSLYAQANEVALGNRGDARRLLGDSLILLKKLIKDFNYHEGIYLQEKINSVLNQKSTLIDNLKKLIIHDSNYLSKVNHDPDFDNFRNEIDTFFEHFRVETENIIKNNIVKCKYISQNYVFLTPEAISLKNELSRMGNFQLDRDKSYFYLAEKADEFNVILENMKPLISANYILLRENWKNEQNLLRISINRVRNQFEIWYNKCLYLEIINENENYKIQENFEKCINQIDINIIESRNMFELYFESTKNELLKIIDKSIHDSEIAQSMHEFDLEFDRIGCWAIALGVLTLLGGLIAKSINEIDQFLILAVLAWLALIIYAIISKKYSSHMQNKFKAKEIELTELLKDIKKFIPPVDLIKFKN